MVIKSAIGEDATALIVTFIRMTLDAGILEIVFHAPLGQFTRRLSSLKTLFAKPVRASAEKIVLVFDCR
jgi:hypothetical protein